LIPSTPFIGKGHHLAKDDENTGSGYLNERWWQTPLNPLALFFKMRGKRPKIGS